MRRKKKKVTIADVARLAGVSEAAVSFCLNNVPHQVSERTRARIFQIIEELGYYPSSAARNLARGSTSLLGVVTVNLLTEPYTEALKGVEETAQRYNMSLLIGDAAGDASRERAYAMLLLERGSEGMVLISASSEKKTEFLTRIARRIPLVVINRPWVRGEFFSVILENRRPMKELVSRLIMNGARKILFVSLYPRTWAFAERMNGYREAMDEAGLEPRKLFFSASEIGRKEIGETVIRRLMREKYHAVVCSGDLLACSVWNAALRSGMKIPDDFLLSGYDDRLESRYLVPSLTTIRQPFLEAGALAASIIMRVRQGVKVKKEYYLEGRVLFRESTG